MSSARDIRQAANKDVAPTPQNTPQVNTLTNSVLSRPSVPKPVAEEDEEEEDVGAALGANRGALQALVAGKLQELVGASSGYVESLPGPVRRRVTALEGVLNEHIALENELQQEILKLQKSFASKFEPLDARRRELVLGTAEPTAKEINAGYKVAEEDAAGEEDSEEEEDDEDNEESGAKVERVPTPTPDELSSAPKGIPEFWLTVLKNHVGIAELITERDEEALQHLVDIHIEYPEAPGFTLVFEFDDGVAKFFSQRRLTKTYLYRDSVSYEGDLVYERAVGTDIDWASPETTLTSLIEVKKQRNKRTNETRTVKKVIPTESFFEFFDPPQEDAEREEEEEEDLEHRLALDYQVGEDFKVRIIPRAVDYFTGKALRFSQDLVDDDDDEEYEDEDEDEEDDDDNDDEDEDEDKPAPAGTGQECKQQ